MSCLKLEAPFDESVEVSVRLFFTEHPPTEQNTADIHYTLKALMRTNTTTDVSIEPCFLFTVGSVLSFTMNEPQIQLMYFCTCCFA